MLSEALSIDTLLRFLERYIYIPYPTKTATANIIGGQAQFSMYLRKKIPAIPPKTAMKNAILSCLSSKRLRNGAFISDFFPHSHISISPRKYFAPPSYMFVCLILIIFLRNDLKYRYFYSAKL